MSCSSVLELEITPTVRPSRPALVSICSIPRSPLVRQRNSRHVLHFFMNRFILSSNVNFRLQRNPGDSCISTRLLVLQREPADSCISNRLLVLQREPGDYCINTRLLVLQREPGDSCISTRLWYCSESQVTTVSTLDCWYCSESQVAPVSALDFGTVARAR